MSVLTRSEASRLAAVRGTGLLESTRDPSLAALTRVAARMLGVPICLISLVDQDIIYLHSAYGLEGTEVPRSQTFCDQVVQSGQPLLIPDAHADPRYRDMPLVRGPPYIRGYAGLPLRDEEGFTLGTLCVIDREARTFSEAEQDILDELASLVMAQVQLRREGTHLVAAETRARRAETAHRDLVRDLRTHAAGPLDQAEKLVARLSSTFPEGLPATARGDLDALGEALERTRTLIDETAVTSSAAPATREPDDDLN